MTEIEVPIFKESDIKELELLGEGSFGKVHKCRIKSLPFNKQVVAVKKCGFFHAQNERDKRRKIKDRFTGKYKVSKDYVLHEVALMIKANHQNVVSCLGVYFSEMRREAGIITEFCERGDLQEFMKGNNKFADEDKIDLMLQIACGVQNLHNLKIVHRDLKPGNILVGNDGCIKLCDFGTSKSLASVGHTYSGTPHYIAPERHVLRKDKVDPLKMDIYSFGCIIYQMLTGHPPYDDWVDKFEGAWKFAVFFHIHTKDIPRPSLDGIKFHIEYVNELKELIKIMWHKEPSKRPKIESIIEKLSKIRAGLFQKLRIRKVNWKEIPITPVQKKPKNTPETQFSPDLSTGDFDDDDELFDLSTYEDSPETGVSMVKISSEFNLETNSFEIDDEGMKLKVKFMACLLLSSVGDALGYKNGAFECCCNGEKMLKIVEELGGLRNINLKEWSISDDTILHLATARALVTAHKNFDRKKSEFLDNLMICMAKEYINSWPELMKRGAGNTCKIGILHLNDIQPENWRQVEYVSTAGGCGAAMRASVIGLVFHGESNREMLIKVGIESGRLTHNTSTGYVGSLMAASFCAFAIEEVPVHKWGMKFLKEIVPDALKYVASCKGREYLGTFKYFIDHLKKFLLDRGLDGDDPEQPPIYSAEFLLNVKMRVEYWKRNFSYAGRAGASGDDSCIVSYDCLMMGGGDYEKTTKYACFHGGDSDSTGCITLAWFGAIYGLPIRGYNPGNVTHIHFQTVEKRDEISKIAKGLFEIAFKLKEN